MLRITILPALILMLQGTACVGNLATPQEVEERIRGKQRSEFESALRSDAGQAAIASVVALLATQNSQSTPAPVDGGTAAAETTYQLSVAEQEQLATTVTVGEARGEHHPEVRQLQVEDLKEMAEYIVSEDMREIGELIGYPPGFEPGMTIHDVQRAYVADLSAQVPGAPDELLGLIKQQLNYQIFGVLDMLSKATFNENTIEESFLKNTLTDLVELRREIITEELRRAELQ